MEHEAISAQLAFGLCNGRHHPGGMREISPLSSAVKFFHGNFHGNLGGGFGLGFKVERGKDGAAFFSAARYLASSYGVRFFQQVNKMRIHLNASDRMTDWYLCPRLVW